MVIHYKLAGICDRGTWFCVGDRGTVSAERRITGMTGRAVGSGDTADWYTGDRLAILPRIYSTPFSEHALSCSLPRRAYTNPHSTTYPPACQSINSLSTNSGQAPQIILSLPGTTCSTSQTRPEGGRMAWNRWLTRIETMAHIQSFSPGENMRQMKSFGWRDMVRVAS